MVESLPWFVRDTRESNWDPQTVAVPLMLPWIFSYDKNNY